MEGALPAEKGPKVSHVSVVNLPSSCSTSSNADMQPCEEGQGRQESMPTSVRPSLYKSVSSPGKTHNVIRHNIKPPLNRTQSIKDKMTVETAKFFGIAPSVTAVLGESSTTGAELDDADVDVLISNGEEQRKWQRRRFRHLNKQYGIKTEAVAEEMQPKIGIDALTDLTGHGSLGKGAGTPMSIGLDVPSPGGVSIARSIDGRMVGRRTTIERRESVAQITLSTLSSILQGSAFRKPRQRRVGELSSSKDQKDGTIISAGTASSCGTYKSIRERNALASNSSFPSSKLYATMSHGIAQADQTVRKISGFLSGSGSTGAKGAEQSESDGENSGRNVIRLDGPLTSSKPVRGGQSLSAKPYFAVPMTAKPELGRTSGVEETIFIPGDKIRSDSAQIQGATLPRTSWKAPQRPSYLPLEGSASQHKQSRRFLSSASVTNDDVFFDLSPSTCPLPLPQPDAAQFPKDGQRKPLTSGVSKDLARSPSAFQIGVLEEAEPPGYAPTSFKKALLRTRSQSWGEGLVSEMPLSHYALRRIEKGQTGTFHGFPVLTRQNGYDMGDGDLQQPSSSASPSATATQLYTYPIQTESETSSFSLSLLQHRAFVNQQQQRLRPARPVFQEHTNKSTSNPFSNFLRWISGRDAEGNAGIKSLIKFHFSTRGSSTVRRPDAAGEAQKRKKSLPIFGKFKRNRKLDPEVVRQLKDESCDYRPFFTYWITSVQVVVMLFTLYSYGVGTDFSNWLGVIERSGDVMASYLSIVRIVVWEPNNVWIGPRFADLVHAGAKYSPCMRRDLKIHEQILKERREEAHSTGCCVGFGGCFQTSECPKQFATLIKWSGNNSLAISYQGSTKKKGNRVVCGQDPRYCRNPKSVDPLDWGRAQISEWPICQEAVPTYLIPKSAKHMHCEITGRPCCIQMHGQCRITTKDYCNFVRGYYHPNATLCSQVSCLNDVCGMTSFLSTDRPDQIYRLITPLFIHAGVIRCLLTVLGQMSIMRNFEIVIGWHRLSIIYFISGIGGYLASAIFVPYMPEVGPAGSQGGVLGALIINVLYNWHFIRRPRKVLLIHLAIAAFLFFTGFIPYIDNWAQLFGFVIGCFLAAALIPYFHFGKRTRHQRIIVVVSSLSITFLIFVILFTTFYAYPIIDNPVFSWLNCPFPSSKVCDHQSLILKNWLPI